MPLDRVVEMEQKGASEKKLLTVFRQTRRDKSLVATLLYFLMRQCDNATRRSFPPHAREGFAAVQLLTVVI